MRSLVVTTLRSFGDASLRLPGDVEAIAVSPSGALVAYGSTGLDGVIQVVDATTHEVRATFCGSAGALAFADESTLWSAFSRLHRWTIGKDGPDVSSSHGTPMAYSRAARRGAAAARSPDATDVIVFDPDGEIVTTIRGSGDRATSLAFSPDGARLAIAYESSAVMFELATEKRTALRVPSGETAVRVAFTGVGEVLVWRDVSGDMLTLDVDARGGARRLPCSIEGAATEEGTERLAITSGDGVRLYEAGSWRRVVESHALWGPVAFLDASRLLAARSRRVVVVDVTRATWERGAPGHDDRISAMAVTSDGAILATAGGFDRMIHLWRLEDGAHLREIEGAHENLILSLAFSPDGKTLVSGSADDSLRLTDVASGKARSVQRGLRSDVTAAYSVRGELATVGGDGAVHFRDHDGASKAVVARIAVKTSFDSATIAFDHTGDYVGCAGPGDEVAIVGSFGDAGGKKIFGAPARAKVIAFAPDAPLFAYATDHELVIAAVPSGRDHARFALPIIDSIAFLGQGRLVAVPYAGRPVLVDVEKKTTVALDLPVATGVVAVSVSDFVLGLPNGTAELVSLSDTLAPSLEPVRVLVRRLGVRHELVGYRDPPVSATLEGDLATTVVVRGDVTLLVRVDAYGDDGWVISLARADAPAAPARPARPSSPAPSRWSRALAAARGWFSSVPAATTGVTPPTPRRPHKFVVRGKLSEPPTAEQLEEWVTRFVNE